MRVTAHFGANPAMLWDRDDVGRSTLGPSTDVSQQMMALPVGRYRAACSFKLETVDDGVQPRCGIAFDERPVDNPSHWIAPIADYPSAEPGDVFEVDREFSVPRVVGNFMYVTIFGCVDADRHACGTADVSVSVYPVDVDEEPPTQLAATDRVRVERVNPDGTTWVVADALSDGESAVDPLPPLNTPFSYRLTAVSELGEAASADFPAAASAERAAFNFGHRASECVEVELNPDWNQSTERSSTLYHFADGGESGGLPVAYGGPDLDRSRSQGFTLISKADLARIQRLADGHPTFWYRDPYGGRYLCAGKWSFKAGVPSSKVDCSADMTDAVFEEAW